MADLREALVEAIDRYVAAKVEELVRAKAEEWVDQASSPLGRARHLSLARNGKLPARKVGRRVMVRRSDVDAYIAAQPAAERPRAEPADELDVELHAITDRRRRR